MLRALLRLLLLLILVAVAAAFLLGWWGNGRVHRPDQPAPVATSGHVDQQRAREVGAEVGEKTATAAERVGDALSDAGLTAKIKSKMALDDSVRARAIDVTTKNHVVTLSGAVRSQAEHDRAVQLAKETAGVTSVVDRLALQR